MALARSERGLEETVSVQRDPRKAIVPALPFGVLVWQRCVLEPRDTADPGW
jgi:hypothetical protein